MKIVTLTLLAVVILGFGSTMAASDDFEPIETENFSSLSDEYLSMQVSDKRDDDYHRSNYSAATEQNLQDIEPAAGNQPLETPNTGFGESIF